MSNVLHLKFRRRARRQKFRERIFRMLIRIGGERNQRFEFTQRIQPGCDMRAVAEPPSLQGKTQMQGIEKRKIDETHHHVVPRVFKIAKRSKRLNGPGSRQFSRQQLRVQ